MHAAADLRLPPPQQHLPFPYQPEARALAAARARLGEGLDWAAAVAAATQSTHWWPTAAERMHSGQTGRPHRVHCT